MDTMETKEKIIWEALEQFSQRGYDAVSVRDISRAVGVRESSLYSHFKSKRDIFDAIVDICWAKAEDYYHSRSLPFAPGDGSEAFALQGEALVERVLEVFAWFFEDPYCSRFRRLLTVSQYENPRAGELYRQLFCQYPMRVQASIFAGLMEAGLMAQGDPEALALEFYGGAFLLMALHDSWQQAKPPLAGHIRWFYQHHRAPLTKEREENP